MELRRFLGILAAALIILLILTIWFFPSNDDFRLDNPFWHGTGDIRAEYEIQAIDSLEELPSSPRGATLLLIPYVSSIPEELHYLKVFVSRGGRLILADDYGHGNEILEYLELEARFSGDTLLDPLVNYKNKRFPRILNFESDPLTSNTDNLVFNHATSLINVSENVVLAMSSPFSFLDYNGDGTRESSEPTGPLPVISRHEVDNGEVILISDPSIFINSMDKIAGNNDFIQNIAATSSVLYLDQSHLTFTELYHSRSLLQRTRDVLATTIGTAVLVLVAIVAALIPIWYRKKKPRTEN